MTIINRNLILTGMACLTACLPSFASELERDYCLNRNEQIYLWGTGKKESYDIAIRLADPGLAGLRLKEISVILPDNFEPVDIKGWLTSELTLDNMGENVADIASADGEIVDGTLLIMFPEGVTIPEGGVYAGYSFGIGEFNEAAKFPVAVGQKTDSDGFFFHSSRTCLSWKNESARYNIVSDMRIVLEGDFAEHSVGLTSIDEAFLLPDSDGNITVTLANHGTESASRISYTVTFADGSTYDSSYVPENPLLPLLEVKNTAYLPVKTPSATGTRMVSIDITGVDGVSNTGKGNSISGLLTVMPFEPQRKVLMEEYTGLWCGACPRGYVALEEMHLRDPENFIALSYHNADQLATIHPTDYPSYVEGFPAAFLDRKVKVDAYYGDTPPTPMGIEQTLKNYSKVFTPGEIEVSLELTDAENLIFNATSTSKFVFDRQDAGIAVAYYLVGDNMSNDSWRQTSYYTSEPSLVEESPFWEPFVNNSKVTGLIFNDIVLASPNVNGTEGSLPSEIVSDMEYTHSCVFNASEIENVYGKKFITKETVYKVIAVLIDKNTGEVLNCAVSEGINSGVDNILSDSEIVDVVYYDLSGRVTEPCGNGIYIRKTVFSDGTSKTEKSIIRN